MSWRNPRYLFMHAARDAGAAAITSANAFHADYPKDYLIDDRAGAICKFNAVASDHYIQLDRGAAGLELIARMIIPEGHNLNGSNVRLRADYNDTFSGTESEILPETAITSDSMINLYPSGGARNRQYVRLDFPNSGSINPEIPELFYTNYRVTTRGPEQGWVDMLRHNTLDFEKESGVIASLSLGADRRFIEYVYRLVSDPLDLAVFSELLATCGTSKPFYLDPCFDTEAPVWMKLIEDSRQSLDRAAPASPLSARPEITLSMLEHLA